MAMPLAPGLAPTHHRRWGVSLRPPRPDEPRGWYKEFLTRWTAYLETLVCPPGSRPTSTVTTEQLARVRPGILRSTVLGGGNEAEQSTSSNTVVGTEVPHGRRRGVLVSAPAQKRRRTVAPGRPSPRSPSSSAASPSPGGQPDALPAAKRPRECTPLQSRQRHRPREESAAAGPPARWQCTLLGWVTSPATQEEEEEAAAAHPKHGRAAQGAPT